MTSKRQQGRSGLHELGTELRGEHWKEKLPRGYELIVYIIGVSVRLCQRQGATEHSSLTRLLGFATLRSFSIANPCASRRPLPQGIHRLFIYLLLDLHNVFCGRYLNILLVEYTEGFYTEHQL